MAAEPAVVSLCHYRGADVEAGEAASQSRVLSDDSCKPVTAEPRMSLQACRFLPFMSERLKQNQPNHLF